MATVWLTHTDSRCACLLLDLHTRICINALKEGHTMNSITVPVMLINGRGKRRMTKQEYVHSDVLHAFVPVDTHNVCKQVLLSEVDDRARAQGLTIALH